LHIVVNNCLSNSRMPAGRISNIEPLFGSAHYREENITPAHLFMIWAIHWLLYPLGSKGIRRKQILSTPNRQGQERMCIFTCHLQIAMLSGLSPSDTRLGHKSNSRHRLNHQPVPRRCVQRKHADPLQLCKGAGCAAQYTGDHLYTPYCCMPRG
jgi:hypothetical protein